MGRARACTSGRTEQGGYSAKIGASEAIIYMLSRRKLPLFLTIVAVLGLAMAVGCKGFFKNPTLTSIAVNPTAPQVNVGQTVQLEAFGTYDDGSRNQITSG